MIDGGYYEVESASSNGTIGSYQVRIDDSPAGRERSDGYFQLSFDVFKRRPATTEYAGSFYSSPTKPDSQTAVAFVGTFHDGGGQTRRDAFVHLTETNGGLEMEFRTALGSSRLVGLTRKTGYLRRITVEVAEAGMDVDDRGLGALMTRVQANFEKERIAVVVRKDDRLLSDPRLESLEVWDERMLATALSLLSSGQQGSPRWLAGLIVAPRFVDRHVAGLMFDIARPWEPNRRPRQGAAIFHRTLADAAEAANRSFLEVAGRTATHELGHCLNLVHPSDTTSTSHMNYPQRYPTGASGYWRDYLESSRRESFGFEEQAWLRHAARDFVIMGGWPLRSSDREDLLTGIPQAPALVDDSIVPHPYDIREILAPNPEVLPIPLRLSLKLKPDQLRGRLPFAAPVWLEAKLESRSLDDLSLTVSLQPSDGATRYVITTPRGEASFFEPVCRRCGDLPPVTLVGGKQAVDRTRRESVNLTYGITGFPFLDPGRYSVQAICRIAEQLLISDPCTFWVAPPAGTASDQVALDAISDDLGEYLAFEGRHDLEVGPAVIADFEDRGVAIGESLLRSELQRCRAVAALDGGVDVDGNGRLTPRAQVAPDEAIVREAAGIVTQGNKLYQDLKRVPVVANLNYSDLVGRIARRFKAVGEDAKADGMIGLVSDYHEKKNFDSSKKPKPQPLDSAITERLRETWLS